MREIYAGLRVSTGLQDAANQKHGILEYANTLGMSGIKFVEDTASGKISWRDRKFGEMLANTQPGDVLLFSEVSRIGRSTFQVLEFLHEAAKKEVQVHIVKNRLIVDGTMQSTIVVTMLGLAAQIEREFISARTKESLAKRKAEGQTLGRPAKSKNKALKLDKDKDKIIDMLPKIGITAMAKYLDVERATLYAFCKVRGIPIPKKEKAEKAKDSKRSMKNEQS